MDKKRYFIFISGESKLENYLLQLLNITFTRMHFYLQQGKGYYDDTKEVYPIGRNTELKNIKCIGEVFEGHFQCPNGSLTLYVLVDSSFYLIQYTWYCPFIKEVTGYNFNIY